MTNNERLIEELTVMLNRKQGAEDDGLTMREILRALGVSYSTATNIIRKLIDDGKIEAYSGMRPNIVGRSTYTVLYRIRQDGAPVV